VISISFLLFTKNQRTRKVSLFLWIAYFNKGKDSAVGKEQKTRAKFCFETESWDEVVEDVVELKEVFRQESEVFVKVTKDQSSHAKDSQ
jgi:hypothetical protein